MWNGTVQRVTKDGRLALLNFDRYTVDLTQFATTMTGKLRETSERYLPELLFPDPTNPWDVRSWNRLIAEGHNRLASPLYAVALAMLGLAGLMCGHFTRRGYAERIALVVIVAFLVRLAGFGLQNAAVKLPILNATQYLVPLSCFAISALMLHHRFDILLERLRPRAAATVPAE
jgi:lipopolysaccharide export system permease protein